MWLALLNVVFLLIPMFIFCLSAVTTLHSMVSITNMTTYLVDIHIIINHSNPIVTFGLIKTFSYFLTENQNQNLIACLSWQLTLFFSLSKYTTYLSYKTFQINTDTLEKWVDNIPSSYCFKKVQNNHKNLLQETRFWTHINCLYDSE